ncbi:MAG: asparaginase [Pseudomonadota bacterium]|nr:asparaginase [Pseudomonadota bacterium]
MLESGAADRFGFTTDELALACASHSGEAVHLRVLRSMLARAGLREDQLECGAHWPSDRVALRELMIAQREPLPAHNNCSGKHAGMLALALTLGVEPTGYVEPVHVVQRTIARALAEVCAVDIDAAPCAIDGCSVPTWAIPLRHLAIGFHRLASGTTLNPARQRASERILAASRQHPDMVAGKNRFCTRLMTAVPRAYVKTGAEGVFCGAVPHAGIGFAVKCDDGATRASEMAVAALLLRLDVWSAAERAALAPFGEVALRNWRGTVVGKVSAMTSPLSSSPIKKTKR